MESRHVRYNQDLVTQLDPLSHISEAFKITRTNVEFSSIDHPARLIAITSSNQAEGKTATIANLAITYAQIGRRVLLIDSDLRRPAVHRLFGLSNRRGLTNALISKGTYQDYVQETQTDNLYLLPSGPIPPNPAEILMSESFSQILTACREDYDLVLIDCPPVGVVTDGAIIASKVDGVVYIVRAGKVDKRQLQRATNLLKQVKARVLGYVLNGINQDTDDYYYMYYQQGYYTEDKKLSPKQMKKEKKRERKEQAKKMAQRGRAPAGKRQMPAANSGQARVRVPDAPVLNRDMPIPRLDTDSLQIDNRKNSLPDRAPNSGGQDHETYSRRVSDRSTLDPDKRSGGGHQGSLISEDD